MILKRGTLWALPLVIVLGAQAPVRAQHVAGPVDTNSWGSGDCASCSTVGSFLSGLFGGGCRSCCQKWFCGPPHHHCAEGPPRIRFHMGCPKPVCPPCDSQFWGYYQTCWSPWPWPADWSHCPVPPPASQVVPPHTWAAEYLDHVQRIQSGQQTAPGTMRAPLSAPSTPPPAELLPLPRKIQ